MISDDEIERIINSDDHSGDMEPIKKCVSMLMKQFDTVQIFCTRHEVDSGGTVNCNYGAGNIFARTAQADIWVLRQKEGDSETGY